MLCTCWKVSKNCPLIIDGPISTGRFKLVTLYHTGLHLINLGIHTLIIDQTKFSIHIDQSIYPSIYLSISFCSYLSIYLLLFTSIYLSIYLLFISIHLFIYLILVYWSIPPWNNFSAIFSKDSWWEFTSFHLLWTRYVISWIQ